MLDNKDLIDLIEVRHTFTNNNKTLFHVLIYFFTTTILSLIFKHPQLSFFSFIFIDKFQIFYKFPIDVSLFQIQKSVARLDNESHLRPTNPFLNNLRQ